MVWEWPDANAQWIETVRGAAFPEDSISSRRSIDQVRRRVAARSIARRRAKEDALQRRRERRSSQEDQ